METIEERVNKMCYFMNGNLRLRDVNIKEALIEIATEQDRISRADERERCIKIAQDWNCKIACANGLDCKSDYKERCVVLEGIRKAMEG